jgi:hypothetical protein
VSVIRLDRGLFYEFSGLFRCLRSTGAHFIKLPNSYEGVNGGSNGYDNREDRIRFVMNGNIFPLLPVSLPKTAKLAIGILGLFVGMGWMMLMFFFWTGNVRRIVAALVIVGVSCYLVYGAI